MWYVVGMVYMQEHTAHYYIMHLILLVLPLMLYGVGMVSGDDGMMVCSGMVWYPYYYWLWMPPLLHHHEEYQP